MAPAAPPPLDWRADIARGARTAPASPASSPTASAERAITDQSQRASDPRDEARAPAPGNAARRAFEREFGSGQASVSGPKATREGGNPLGTRECIEMDGKKVCSRQRNRASDIDPFITRERVFSPDAR
jgi:hypothetical protein